MAMTVEEVQALIKATLETVLKNPIEDLQRMQNDQMTSFKEGVMAMAKAKVSAEHEGKGLNVARFIKSLAATKGNQTEAERYAGKHYGKDAEVTKALASSDFVAGGALVPQNFIDEVIELLRPRSVVRRMTPTMVDLVNGTATLPKLTGGATASYIGENQDIPESQQTVGDLKLTFKKLVSLVPISNDLLRFGSARTDALIRDDIITSLAQREDVAFIRDDGTNDKPKGMRHWAPAANLITANATVNLANVTADLAQMVLALENANVAMIRPTWFMAPRSKAFLMSLRDGNGNYAFRDEMLAGSLWGFPFASTTQIPKNLGGGGNESEIYLIDMADAVIGEAAGLTVDASSEAAYKSGANLISAFSRDQTVIRAVAEHDFGMRHDASVVVLIAVTWTP